MPAPTAVHAAIIANVEEKLTDMITNSGVGTPLMIASTNFIAAEKEFDAQKKIYLKALQDILNQDKLRAQLAMVNVEDLSGLSRALQKQVDFLIKQEQKTLTVANALMQAQHEMLEAIRDFVGTKVRMIYAGGTYSDSTTYDITDVIPSASFGRSLQTILREGLGSTKHFIDFRYQLSGAKSTAMTVAERYGLTKTVATRLDALFKEINHRIDVARAVKSPYLLWQVGGEWRKAKITQLGDLKEAYMALVATGGAESLVELNDYDAAINAFVSNYLSHVDSGQAFDTEDVKISDSEYLGIKSGQASAPGYKRLLDFAKMVATGQISHDLLMRTAKSIVGHERNKITTAADTEYDEQVTALFNQGSFKI